MKAYSFNITVASQDLDIEDVESFVNASLEEHLPEEVLVLVKSDGVKQYSEQGWKVARQRKFGIDVKQAGDAHKATQAKSELLVSHDTADAVLPGV